MRAAAILALMFVCSSSLACGEPAAQGEPSSSSAKQPAAAARVEPPKPAPPPPPPAWLLVPWDAKLRTAPDQYAPALTLVAPAEANAAPQERGRVVKVVGTADPEGRWWKLETVAQPQLDEQIEGTIPGRPIEGLDVYAISLYVPAGTGEPLQPVELPAPDPDAARQAALEAAKQYGIIAVLNGTSVIVQTGEPRVANLEKEWQLDPGAQVFWPNGKAAGTVRQLHAFVRAGETRKIESRELRCFAVRVGPPLQQPTELCFEPAAVREVEPISAADLYGDETDDGALDGLFSGDIGEAQIGGFGFEGTDLKKKGPDHGNPGVENIGMIGHGSGAE